MMKARSEPSAAGRAGNGDAVIEAAWLYYHDGLNQSAVADRLGVSRATVVNYLQEARERGLVRVSLADEPFVAPPPGAGPGRAVRAEGRLCRPHRPRRRRGGGAAPGGARRGAVAAIAAGAGGHPGRGLGPHRVRGRRLAGADRDPRPDGGPADRLHGLALRLHGGNLLGAAGPSGWARPASICMSRRCCPPPGWPRSFGASRSSPSSWRRSAAATRRCSPPARARRTAISSAPASRRQADLDAYIRAGARGRAERPVHRRPGPRRPRPAGAADDGHRRGCPEGHPDRHSSSR